MFDSSVTRGARQHECGALANIALRLAPPGRIRPAPPRPGAPACALRFPLPRRGARGARVYRLVEALTPYPAPCTTTPVTGVGREQLLYLGDAYYAVPVVLPVVSRTENGTLMYSSLMTRSTR